MAIRKRLLASGAAIGGGLLSTLLAGSALAQPAPAAAGPVSLEEVVVTASKTGEGRLQDTPMAIYAVTSDDLEKKLITNIQSLSQLAPGLVVAQTAIGAQIYIRGVGTNNVFAGGDPDVTVQVDGVYMPNAYAQFANFLDVQRIEILRGPQGTLYGRNAVGGTLNIISKLPSDDFQATEQLTLGNYNLVHEQAQVSGPIIKGVLQAGASLNYMRRDYFAKNIFAGRRTAGVADADTVGARLQLRFTPNDRFEAITRADYNSNSSTPDIGDHLIRAFALTPVASSIVGDLSKVALDTQQVSQVDLRGIMEEINFRASDNIRVKSITAYRLHKASARYDTDRTELPVNVGSLRDRTTQFTQELNVIGDFGDFQGIVGAYYLRSRDRLRLTALGANSTGAPASRTFSDINPNVLTESSAAFAQGSYNFTPQLSLTVGVRYTKDKKSGEQTYFRNPAPAFPALGPSAAGFPFNYAFSDTYDAFTPKGTIEWKPRPGFLAYATVARGYKSGGVNYGATDTRALRFAPEQLTDYEGGVKTEWLDRRLIVNAAAFQYKYSDLQVTSLLGPGLVSIGNAAKATIKGLELELTARPVASLSFGGKLSLLDATYDEFRNASVPTSVLADVVVLPGYDPSTAPATFNAAGNRLNAAPKQAYSLWVEYTHDMGPGEAMAQLEYSGQSRTYYDPTNVRVLSQGSYGVANVVLGYSWGDNAWSLKAIGSNIFKEKYFTSISANTSAVGVAGDPRTFAVRLTRKW